MVVFTCGHCGESVNKPKVEKHYLTKCRNRNPNLSCMDCFKDFFGKDYEEHTKCVTEEQRYAAKGFVAKEKKGEQKQNVWVELVQSVLDEQPNASKNVLRILEAVSKHNNTPRKKPKFINFVKNICGNKTNPKDIDCAWDFLSVKLAELSSNNQNKNQKQNDANAEPKEEANDEILSDENTQSKENKNDNGQILNGHENGQNGHDNGQNGHDNENGHAELPDTEEIPNDNDKKSKKQRKEEKKRQKYQAELKKAAEPLPEEEEVEEKLTKKEKKKIRTKSSSENIDEDNSNKKRKRQVTVSASSDSNEAPPKDAEGDEKPTETIKATKKKPKVDENEDEGICLHDQNVANAGESERTNGNFNWHAVILSVLSKKGNEIPFKRLQKKVLGEYSEATGQDVDDRIADKFIKKLKSAPNVRVDKNRVYIID